MTYQTLIFSPQFSPKEMDEHCANINKFTNSQAHTHTHTHSSAHRVVS